MRVEDEKPLRLEPFQERFLRDVFSGKPVCWLVVPQGNGKSTLISLLALYMIEHKKLAKVFVLAATREQATDNDFGQMEVLVVNSDLEKKFKLQLGNRRVICPETRSRIQIRASDEDTADGAVADFVIVDELHRHKTLGLYRMLRGKLKKRKAQMVVISTAGEPGGEFEELREKMRQMAEETEREETFTRAVGDSYVLHDWSVPEDGDTDDLDLVARANPISSITVESLREERESPDWAFSYWRRLTCNLPTRSELAAITEAEWYGAQTDERIPEGEPVAVGIDIGWKHDTTAIQPLWCRDAEFRLLDLGVTLVPPRDGNSLHPDRIKSELYKLREQNPIHKIVMDVSNAEDIGHWIEDELGCELIDRGQSNKFACEDFERFMEALRQGWLKHTGDRDLTRHVLNAISRPATYGDLRFDRPSPQRGSARLQDVRVIDRLTAAAMVHTDASYELQAGGEYAFL